MDLFDQNKNDIEDWFLIQSKKMQSNSSIITSNDIGQNFMLHIDKKRPKLFVPCMPRSAALSEDNTTPRVSVAPNLLGCLIGYARVEYDFFNEVTSTSKQTEYRGGYEICEIEFTHCIKPLKTLVFDADRTLEHWLVTFNKSTIQYKSNEIGKIFISNISYSAANKKDPSSTFIFYIEHSKDVGINLTPNIHLKPGYHRVEFYSDNSRKMDVNNEKDIKVFDITADEYTEAKGLSASMLNYQESLPCMNW